MQFSVSGKIRSLTKESTTNSFSQITGVHPLKTYLISPRQNSQGLHLLNVYVGMRDVAKIMQMVNSKTLSNKGFHLKRSPEFLNRSTIVFKGNQKSINTLKNAISRKDVSDNKRIFIEYLSIKTTINCAFICFSSPVIANKYANEGFHIGKMYITPDSLSKYDSKHVLQCYHCYEWGSHTTNQCEHPKKQKWCSICASKYHTHRYCPNEDKKGPQMP